MSIRNHSFFHSERNFDKQHINVVANVYMIPASEGFIRDGMFAESPTVYGNLVAGSIRDGLASVAGQSSSATLVQSSEYLRATESYSQSAWKGSPARHSTLNKNGISYTFRLQKFPGLRKMCHGFLRKYTKKNFSGIFSSKKEDQTCRSEKQGSFYDVDSCKRIGSPTLSRNHDYGATQPMGEGMEGRHWNLEGQDQYCTPNNAESCDNMRTRNRNTSKRGDIGHLRNTGDHLTAREQFEEDVQFYQSELTKRFHIQTTENRLSDESCRNIDHGDDSEEESMCIHPSDSYRSTMSCKDPPSGLSQGPVPDQALAMGVRTSSIGRNVEFLSGDQKPEVSFLCLSEDDEVLQQEVIQDVMSHLQDPGAPTGGFSHLHEASFHPIDTSQDLSSQFIYSAQPEKGTVPAPVKANVEVTNMSGYPYAGSFDISEAIHPEGGNNVSRSGRPSLSAPLQPLDYMQSEHGILHPSKSESASTYTPIAPASPSLKVHFPKSDLDSLHTTHPSAMSETSHSIYLSGSASPISQSTRPLQYAVLPSTHTHSLRPEADKFLPASAIRDDSRIMIDEGVRTKQCNETAGKQDTALYSAPGLDLSERDFVRSSMARISPTNCPPPDSDCHSIQSSSTSEMTAFSFSRKNGSSSSISSAANSPSTHSFGSRPYEYAPSSRSGSFVCLSSSDISLDRPRVDQLVERQSMIDNVMPEKHGIKIKPVRKENAPSYNAPSYLDRERGLTSPTMTVASFQSQFSQNGFNSPSVTSVPSLPYSPYHGRDTWTSLVSQVATPFSAIPLSPIMPSGMYNYTPSSRNQSSVRLSGSYHCLEQSAAIQRDDCRMTDVSTADKNGNMSSIGKRLLKVIRENLNRNLEKIDQYKLNAFFTEEYRESLDEMGNTTNTKWGQRSDQATKPQSVCFHHAAMIKAKKEVERLSDIVRSQTEELDKFRTELSPPPPYSYDNADV